MVVTDTHYVSLKDRYSDPNGSIYKLLVTDWEVPDLWIHVTTHSVAVFDTTSFKDKDKLSAVGISTWVATFGLVMSMDTIRELTLNVTFEEKAAAFFTYSIDTIATCLSTDIEKQKKIRAGLKVILKNFERPILFIRII